MRQEKTGTPLRRVLLAAACFLSAVPAFAADGAETEYLYESEQWNLD